MKKDIIEIKNRLDKLEKAVFGGEVEGVVFTRKNDDLDFTLNERAFIKKYSSDFNGQEVFTLIVAYLSGGREADHVDLSRIKTVWQSCKGIIGISYARTYSTRAKENGWVDAVKDSKGSYLLGKHWQDIFKKNDQNP